ncbi:hypothetical protein [Chitinimonas naiadis]
MSAAFFPTQTLPSETCQLTQREEVLVLFLEGAGFERDARCEIVAAVRESRYLAAVGRKLGRDLPLSDERAALQYFSRGLSSEQAAGLLSQARLALA